MNPENRNLESRSRYYVPNDQNLPETANVPRRVKPPKKRKFSFDVLNAEVKRGVKQNKHITQRLGARLAKIPQSPLGCNSTDNSGKSTFKKPTTIMNDKKIKLKNKSSLEKTAGKKITSNKLKNNLTKELLIKQMYDVEKEFKEMFRSIFNDTLVISSLKNPPDQLSKYKETSDNVNNNNLNNPNNCSIVSSNTSAIVGSNLPRTKTKDTQEPSFDTEQYSGQSSSHNLGSQYAVENSIVFETPMLASNLSLLAFDKLAEDNTARRINNTEKYKDFLKKLAFYVLYSIKRCVVRNQIDLDEDFETESKHFRQYFCTIVEELLNELENSFQSDIVPLNEYKKFIKYLRCYINYNMEFPTTIGNVCRGLNQGLSQFCFKTRHEKDSKFYRKIVDLMMSLIESIQHEELSSEIVRLDFTEIDDFVEILVYHKRTEWYSLFTEEHIVFKELDEWVRSRVLHSRILKDAASWTNQTDFNIMLCQIDTGIQDSIIVIDDEDTELCQSTNATEPNIMSCQIDTGIQDSIIVIDDEDTELCQSTNATEPNIMSCQIDTGIQDSIIVIDDEDTELCQSTNATEPNIMSCQIDTGIQDSIIVIDDEDTELCQSTNATEPNIMSCQIDTGIQDSIIVIDDEDTELCQSTNATEPNIMSCQIDTGIQDSIIVIDDEDTELCQSTNATEQNSDHQRQGNKTEVL